MSRAIDIRDEYFVWLMDKIGGANYHDKLLEYLFIREFIWTHPYDENRSADGINLRYQFADETEHTQAEIARYLDDRGCSILEMMVALALRCEFEIMTDFKEDSTSKWFWIMISNLCLMDQTDNIYNEGIVSVIIDNFLERKYLRNGVGGLFKLSNSEDARKMDIWQQMCSYLNGIID